MMLGVGITYTGNEGCRALPGDAFDGVPHDGYKWRGSGEPVAARAYGFFYYMIPSIRITDAGCIVVFYLVDLGYRTLGNTC
jgi:hypothetical protein